MYLYAGDPPNWTTPAGALQDALKVFPTFTGKVGDDVVFFGFPIEPAALSRHWVVLEEPPSGYRFYTEDPHAAFDPDVPDPPLAAAGAAPSAADFGHATFAVPVRVMIADLVEQAP